MKLLLTPAQEQIVKDNHRFRVVNCGRRFGKSTLAVIEMIGKAVSKSDQNIAYIAPTYQQARDIAWNLLKKLAQPVINTVNESRLELSLKTQQGGNSVISLRGWESVETLRGQKFDLVVIDEIAMMRNFWENWLEVVRPTLTDTKGQGLFTSTPKGFNHFYDLFNLQDKDDDFCSFHFTTYDNPLIPVEEIEKAKLELPEDKFAQEYLADFRKTEGLVYKEFNREKHTTTNIPENYKETILGIDWGYTNPSAVLKIIVDNDNNYWIVDEYYKTKKTTEQIIEVALSMKPNMVYPDPAEADRVAMLVDKGLNVREVSKDIVAGIDKVRELFKQNRIKIHKNCASLIQELETYSYPEKKSNSNEQEKPIKENDHACDALRYALYSYQPNQNEIPKNFLEYEIYSKQSFS